ncbi:MAG: hypothetical protein LBF24_01360 [Puniceicoccales bacterium]|jgi:hypothetical protein|nr:hypothetical protein [Puniceicoccales bacterium]
METQSWGEKPLSRDESGFKRGADGLKILGSAAAMAKGGNRQGASELLKVVGTEFAKDLGLSRTDLHELAGLFNELESPTQQFTAYNVTTEWLPKCEYLLEKLGKTIKSVEMGDGSVKISWENEKPR